MNANRLSPVGLTLLIACLTSGCSGNLIANLIEESSGQITVVFINNTPFRASFTFGAFDDLDRDPGGVEFQQQRLEAQTSTAPATLTCGRDVAVGTRKLVDRIVDTRSNLADTFDDDAFDAVIHFSAAPADSDGAALPDAGTGDGMLVRLGVDFSCGDELIFTLEEDPSAPGGFRVDFALLADEEDDS